MPYGSMLIQQGMLPPCRDWQIKRILTPKEKTLAADGDANDGQHGADERARV